MFDFVGDYINWATSDGWSNSSLVLLALGAFAVVLAALVALGFLVALSAAARWFVEGIKVGLSDDPAATRGAIEAKRKADREAFDDLNAKAGRPERK